MGPRTAAYMQAVWPEMIQLHEPAWTDWSGTDHPARTLELWMWPVRIAFLQYYPEDGPSSSSAATCSQSGALDLRDVPLAQVTAPTAAAQVTSATTCQLTRCCTQPPVAASAGDCADGSVRALADAANGGGGGTQ